MRSKIISIPPHIQIYETRIKILQAYLQNDLAEEKRLLKYLLEHIYNTPSLSFKNGLTGTGWILAFLFENNHNHFNYQHILTEIDDIVYKWVILDKNLSFSIEYGYLGILCYFYLRLKKWHGSYYQELALKECSIIILGRLLHEAQKQNQAKLSPIEWIVLQILAMLFKRLQLQKNLPKKILQETHKQIPTMKAYLKQLDLTTKRQKYLYKLLENTPNVRFWKFLFIN